MWFDGFRLENGLVNPNGYLSSLEVKIVTSIVVPTGVSFNFKWTRRFPRYSVWLARTPLDLRHRWHLWVIEHKNAPASHSVVLFEVFILQTELSSVLELKILSLTCVVWHTEEMYDQSPQARSGPCCDLRWKHLVLTTTKNCVFCFGKDEVRKSWELLSGQISFANSGNKWQTMSS